MDLAPGPPGGQCLRDQRICDPAGSGDLDRAHSGDGDWRMIGFHAGR